MTASWLTSTCLAGVLLVFILIVFYRRDSPLRHIPGPPGSGFSSLRHVRSIISKGLLDDYVTWCRQYGTSPLHHSGKDDVRGRADIGL